jgi:hypothetical protein
MAVHLLPGADSAVLGALSAKGNVALSAEDLQVVWTPIAQHRSRRVLGPEGTVRRICHELVPLILIDLLVQGSDDGTA